MMTMNMLVSFLQLLTLVSETMATVATCACSALQHHRDTAVPVLIH